MRKVCILVSALVLGMYTLAVPALADHGHKWSGHTKEDFLSLLERGKCYAINTIELFWYDVDGSPSELFMLISFTGKNGTVSHFAAELRHSLTLTAEGKPMAVNACLIPVTETNSGWSVIFLPTLARKTEMDNAIENALELYYMDIIKEPQRLPLPVYTGKEK